MWHVTHRALFRFINPSISRRAVILFLAGIMSLFLTACAPPSQKSAPLILLFNGTGTSPNDVKAIEAILKSKGLGYSMVNSRQLDEMSESEMGAYRLLIFPGGNYLTIGDHLTSNATTTVHRAVQGGLNYLGICAGGILAGNVPGHGLNLTAGVRFDFYVVVNRGIHKAPVAIAVAGAPAIEHYWEDGPQFAGWGNVVGKYPDGTPAIVQGTSGKGWVVLCGVHPEAPANWRHGMTFTTPASTANAYAGTLIDAALHGTELPHY